MTNDAEKTKLSEKEPPKADGSMLRVRCSGGTIFSCSVFLLISAAFIVMSLYAFFTGQLSIGTTLVITLVLLPFAVGLFIAILGSPRYYIFDPDVIVEKKVIGQQRYPVSKITQFSCGQRFVKVNAKIGSYFAHFVELTFEGSKTKLVIDNKDTNYPIEELSDFLTKTYHLEGIKKVVTPERGGRK